MTSFKNCRFLTPNESRSPLSSSSAISDSSPSARFRFSIINTYFEFFVANIGDNSITATAPYEKKRAIINVGCYIFSLPLSFNCRRYRLADTFKPWAPKSEVLILLMETQESRFSCRSMYRLSSFSSGRSISSSNVWKYLTISHCKRWFSSLAAYWELTIREVTIAYDWRVIFKFLFLITYYMFTEYIFEIPSLFFKQNWWKNSEIFAKKLCF